ncbi:hypothetical protein IOLA_304 [uncultured bacterium]|nr:hypothetical protein IOLA_304 [uncultured bacterium]
MHNIDKKILNIEKKMHYALDLINIKLEEDVFKTMLTTIESQFLFSEFIYQPFIKNYEEVNSIIQKSEQILYYTPIELYRKFNFINNDSINIDTNSNPLYLFSNKNFIKINI